MAWIQTSISHKILWWLLFHSAALTLCPFLPRSNYYVVGAVSNNLMRHLNLITLQPRRSVSPINTLFICNHCKYNWRSTVAASGWPVVVWQKDKRSPARLLIQNIHETHIQPYLCLISELLPQLSGWCSTLHATEWIIDFPPTWEIPLPEYHPTSARPNTCKRKKCLSPREKQIQTLTTVSLMPPWGVCQMSRFILYFSYCDIQNECRDTLLLCSLLFLLKMKCDY